MTNCLNCGKRIDKISYYQSLFLCQRCWEKLRNLPKRDKHWLLTELRAKRGKNLPTKNL